MFWTLITNILVAVMFSIVFPVLTIVIVRIVEIISKKQKLRQEQPVHPFIHPRHIGCHWDSKIFVL